MFDWIARAYRKKLRGTDIKVLWPMVKRISEEGGFDIEKAKWVFFLHAKRDSAWYKDFNDEELIEVINSLE